MNLRNFIIKILGSSREVTDLARYIKDHKPKPARQSTSLYRVQEGDTWALIAHRFYGNAHLESKLKNANPGLESDEPEPDEIIRIP